MKQVTASTLRGCSATDVTDVDFIPYLYGNTVSFTRSRSEMNWILKQCDDSDQT